MLKSCAKWSERLSAYLDNEDRTQERQQVEAHLRECAACRAGELPNCRLVSKISPTMVCHALVRLAARAMSNPVTMPGRADLRTTLRKEYPMDMPSAAAPSR